MDFIRLVKDGKYSYKDLKDERHKAFIDGMRAVKESLDSLAADYEDDEELCLRDRLENETKLEALDDAADWIEAEICEHIVAFVDQEVSEAQTVTNKDSE